MLHPPGLGVDLCVFHLVGPHCLPTMVIDDEFGGRGALVNGPDEAVDGGGRHYLIEVKCGVVCVCVFVRCCRGMLSLCVWEERGEGLV